MLPFKRNKPSIVLQNLKECPQDTVEKTLISILQLDLMVKILESIQLRVKVYQSIFANSNLWTAMTDAKSLGDPGTWRPTHSA